MATPFEMAHSGRLLGADGGPVNGDVALQVRLFDGGSASAAQLWVDTYDVSVQDGFYSVVLGSGVALDTETHLATPEVWVDVVVDGSVLGGRMRLLAVPYAARAHSLASGASVGGALQLGSEDDAWCQSGREGGLVFDATLQRLKVCTASGWQLVGEVPLVEVSGSRQWSDGSLASACWDYRNPTGLYSYSGAVGSGVYRVDPAANGTGFNVYCDMDFEGGGWTLVDNDATNAAAFSSRTSGALTSVDTTGGRLLPAYDWSSDPLMMCRSSRFNGSAGWLTLAAGGVIAKQYPTAVTRSSSHSAGWSVRELNGNTNQGMTSWIYNGSGRFGSVWIGNGGQSTCSCDYVGSQSGLGTYGAANTSTCSTWVR